MKKIIVIGNGMVGYKFCEKIRKTFDASRLSLTVYGEEPRPAYDRVHLSNYFSGATAEDLLLAPRSWYEDNDINLLTGELVTAIDRENRQIYTHKGKRESYDYLVLATGSSAFVPPIRGVERHGVFVYRTIEDLNQILTYGKKIKKAAVLGGGLLGLEAAKALLDMSLETYVVEFADRLMPRQLDDAASDILRMKLTTLGVNILLGKATKEIKGNGKLDGLEFADGTHLDVEMLVISTGIRPRDELAKAANLTIHERGGVLVNEQLQTSDTHIYAIGEVACYQNMIYGLVAPGNEMAEVAIDQMMGAKERIFKGFDMSTKLKLIGVDVGCFGDPFGSSDAVKPLVYKNENTGIYRRLNVTADGKYLTGGILIGDADDYNILHQMVQNKMKLTVAPEALLVKTSAKEEGGAPGVESLPDEAVICSCENVTKGQIQDMVRANENCTINDIKAQTGACTGCGGCTPMVSDLMKASLKSMGKLVKNNLCEHFDYSRQELYDLIKINDIRSFSTLIKTNGKGHGCEVCKPVVASLFASIYNEPAIVHDTIQDTNDRFLANIQRGGTYSVVPRIPGGEITPDKLLAIGSVAKKYGLYTKITGGQRIDLFGALLHQLPDIWEELIEAGFESGHAYAKSLRTVKSCVGSTWCRYGVQDSVSFAIRVEERYKGLRSPHKLKGGVSGCIRECAEAQSKDFGIIATEKGWNVYVCGNGGSRPQHACLLATDVDAETCIRLIDRFLMYYIKTAAPLTRTATWLNKLDGGIEYLKEVVVKDSLGLADTLEKEMQGLLENYECEWKRAISDPDLRSKFAHFVNSTEEDASLSFVDLRGQKMPAAWG
ncbi:MAG: nitrite reductase large subunit [Cyclobacteriaceae bacterium]|nr:nitrite reductase large subunit [Cyclobacteriaceae bacterium]